MIPQLRKYLLENWRSLCPGVSKPRQLDFLVQATGISKVCCYVFVNDEAQPRWVAKMPRSPRDNGVLAHEYSVTRHLREAGSGYVRDTIAGPVLTATISGNLVGIEPYLQGRPMDGLMSVARNCDAPEVVDNLELALDWLLRCQQSTLMEPHRLSEQELETYLLRPVAQMRATSRLTPNEAAYLDTLEDDINLLADLPLPLVFKHGDFQPGNILVNGKAIHVIDWEFGAVLGLPLHDVFGFIARTYARYRGMEEMDGFLEDYIADFEAVFFTDGEFTQYTRKHIGQACLELGVDEAWVRPLFALFIVNEANKYHALLSGRAERGYVYLLKSKAEKWQTPYTEQLARQKQVWLLGHLAQNEDRLLFPRSAVQSQTQVKRVATEAFDKVGVA
ncbi:MAG: aminoglycoside phosphotransferase family protein [Chloroflexota bacterium]